MPDQQRTNLLDAQANERPAVSCRLCDLFDLCFPPGLPAMEQRHYQCGMHKMRQLKRCSYLYLAGQRAASIFAVRAGSIKTYSLHAGGEEIIEGFHFAGELLGLDALNRPVRDHFAVALEDSEYCDLPVSTLEKWFDSVPGLRDDLLSMLARQLSEQRLHRRVHTARQARYRVLAFVTDIARRRASHNQDAERFRLSMDRAEIAGYLGLTQETVSRCLQDLHREGLLRVRGKSIRFPVCEPPPPGQDCEPGEYLRTP